MKEISDYAEREKECQEYDTLFHVNLEKLKSICRFRLPNDS